MVGRIAPGARHRGCTPTSLVSEGSDMSKRFMLVVAVVLVVGSAIGVTIAGAQGGSDDSARNTFVARLSGGNEAGGGGTDPAGAPGGRRPRGGVRRRTSAAGP